VATFKEWINDNLLGSGEAANARTRIKERPKKVDDAVDEAVNGPKPAASAPEDTYKPRVGTTGEWKK